MDPANQNQNSDDNEAKKPENDPPKNNKRGEARISQPLRFEVASADSGGLAGCL